MEISFDSNFVTDNADISVYSLDTIIPCEDYLLDKIVSCKVIWSLDPEMRNDRIKSMGLSIKRVTAIINWENTDEENGSDGVIEFDSSAEVYKDWIMVNEVKFEPDGGVSISTVEIDFERKTITVS